MKPVLRSQSSCRLESPTRWTTGPFSASRVNAQPATACASHFCASTRRISLTPCISTCHYPQFCCTHSRPANLPVWPKPRRGGLFIVVSRPPVFPFCFSAARRCGLNRTCCPRAAEKQKGKTYYWAGRSINRPPLRGLSRPAGPAAELAHLPQSASDCRMISSNSSLVGPLPKVNVPVRCVQSSNDRP